jgi:GT2 family glycosyltransferase
MSHIPYEAGRRSPFRTAWSLYGSPDRLPAALYKAARILTSQGPAVLIRAARRKLHHPGQPVEHLIAHPDAPSVTYEDKFPPCGQGLTSTHGVTAIVLTKGNGERLHHQIALLARSLAPNSRFELIVVNNGKPLSAPQAPFPVSVIAEHRPFNWSAYNNSAAAKASFPFLLFLNDDVFPLHPGWLDAMLAEALAPGVGAVGAKLLYPDGTIQHAGIQLTLGPEGGHAHKLAPRDTPPPAHVDAVTGACLLTPTSVFRRVNGFDPGLRFDYNDVEYCLRLRLHGLATRVCPHAELLHLESATRQFRTDPNDREHFRRFLRTFDGQLAGRQHRS